MIEVTTSPHFVVHDKPVWRDRASSVIRAEVPNPPGDGEWFEQLWAKKLGDGRYEICCVPFATYDYALGDIVDVEPGGDSTYLIHGLLEPSGRRVLRVWLAEADRPLSDELEAMLRFRRLVFEFRKPGLVAIDAPDDDAAKSLEDELQRLEKAGKLRYERGSQGYRPTAGNREGEQ